MDDVRRLVMFLSYWWVVVHPDVLHLRAKCTADSQSTVITCLLIPLCRRSGHICISSIQHSHCCSITQRLTTTRSRPDVPKVSFLTGTLTRFYLSPHTNISRLFSSHDHFVWMGSTVCVPYGVFKAKAIITWKNHISVYRHNITNNYEVSCIHRPHVSLRQRSTSRDRNTAKALRLRSQTHIQTPKIIH